MKLFERIPERFFTILTSNKRELYVEALFVLRQAFKSELVIRRTDLVAMLVDALEMTMLQADFSEEAEEMDGSTKADISLSGKAYLLVRRLKESGWLEVEYESNSFEENIMIPDYAIQMINLLYDLSAEEKKEYNSYVFATYASLKNTEENPDYLYQALQSAYGNTVKLVDELKSLFNNIKRYYQRITAELGVNELLAEHFDSYKEQVVDTVYYPLKTIDSVPRFKHSIVTILNEWLLDTDRINNTVMQGKQRRIYASEEEGREDTIAKINYIVETYENIEGMISEIDHKHIDYTNATIDRIRYMMNADRSAKGKLVELMKHTGEARIYHEMESAVLIYQHTFLDGHSLYDRVRRTVRSEGRPLPVEEIEKDDGMVSGFLEEVKKQYSSRKIDEFIERCFNGGTEFSTLDILVDSPEVFVLLMLGTIRGSDKGAGYYVEFQDGTTDNQGYRLPLVIFQKKGV